MNTTRKIVSSAPNSSAFTLFINWFKNYQGKLGLLCLGIVLTALSVLAALNLGERPRYFAVGEMAGRDIVATRDMIVEDTHATQIKREQVGRLQPGVFDLHQETAFALRAKVQDIFTLLNQSTMEDWENIALILEQKYNLKADSERIRIWSEPEFQELVSQEIIPYLEPLIREGVVGDFREFLEHRGGIIIQDPVQASEDFLSETASIPDLRELESSLSQYLKNKLKTTRHINQAATGFVTPLISPSLTLNRESTSELARRAALQVEPVTYHVHRGETIVRQGERVTPEQQLKLTAMWQQQNSNFNLMRFAGALLISSILAAGLFISPSGRRGSELTRRDLLFIALLLGFFVLLDKLLMTHAQGAIEQPLFSTAVMPYMFPVAGVAGLGALVFSARRYCVLGLLISFFCTLNANGGIDLFLFYFLGAMWNTWLVSRTQNRHEMFFSVLPLTIGLITIWAGCASFSNLDLNLWSAAMGAVLLNAVISLLLAFALSPILEIIFRYTTRFRLMELMNLEQPLLQQLMMTAPGTYHHSLVVSNLVEAAAKQVGANAMLCKVAALYHDIGKLTKPDYFIENLLGRPNKHDTLAPSMSALILVSHVKRGVELAQEYKLGEEIIDIIRQHHGNNVIKYFYKKALDAGENPNIEDYRYPGPRPQSKEAAIVMLADVVEASSRTLVDPTPSRVQNHIQNMVQMIFSEGQLDESQLTFRDLNKISEAFMRILTGIFHHRIEYPEPK
ncbi:MAG: HDIG domain-containing protein [Desulfovibrionaceae bacterium]|nr:HDIG domain-containing protein [Desulfovibrionaceae bacterium]